MFSPMPPQPITATVEPKTTCAAFVTAPTPVITPQPMSAAFSKEKALSIFTTEASGIVLTEENAETPA